jgi:hypothetical protein
MEPLTAATIGTLILTKAFEKSGEKLGEKVLAEGGKLLALLKRKAPDTATAIETVAQQPILAEQQPATYSPTALTQRMEAAAAADPEVKLALQAVADAANAQPSMVQNLTKLAEKIGINIQGGTNSISGNTFNL